MKKKNIEERTKNDLKPGETIHEGHKWEGNRVMLGPLGVSGQGVADKGIVITESSTNLYANSRNGKP